MRAGEAALALPPSKKTRALFAYLVLTQRAHRREQLCKLFWDVTDDPRGALRWSLSKLRPLCDADGQTRLLADRESVRFTVLGAEVDALMLREALRGRALATIPTAELEQVSERYQGELLEGLELPDFDDYQAWCLAEREELRALRAGVAKELTGRLSGEPARALEHARRWLALDPLQESARASVVRLLGQLGRFEEARQHYESGLRLEAELGRKGRGELREAFRALRAGAASEPGPERGSRDVSPTAAVASEPVQAEERRTSKELAGERFATASADPFVGREAERALLDAALARCRGRRTPELLLFTGEPGVGKTRLVEHWTTSLPAQDVPALRGASYEAETGHPYAPWLEALNAGAPELAAALQDVLRARHEGPLQADAQGRERLFAVLSEGLTRLAARAQGLVVVFDDVQWLDEGSAELLHYAVRTAGTSPLLFVLLGREGELADNAALSRVLRGLRREGSVAEHALGPLLHEETVALVRAVDAQLDPERVARESGGNPLFALELSRAGARDAVPASLSALVRDRLSLLPAEAADVLRWAAVLGCGFGVERIAQLTSLRTESLLDALDLLERRALLRQAGEGAEAYVFAHELVRRVVYTDLSEPRRRLMHRRWRSCSRPRPR